MYKNYDRSTASIFARQNRPHEIGRPPKLTNEMIEQICDHLLQGNTLSMSANLSGVSESTLHRWLAIGRKTESNSMHKRLFDAVSETIETTEMELIQHLRVSLEQTNNWKIAAWLLERRFPEKYGKVNKTEISLQDNPEDPQYGELAVIGN